MSRPETAEISRLQGEIANLQEQADPLKRSANDPEIQAQLAEHQAELRPSMHESPNYPASADWTDAPDDPDFEPDIIDIYEDDAGAADWETDEDEEARFIARYLVQNAA